MTVSGADRINAPVMNTAITGAFVSAFSIFTVGMLYPVKRLFKVGKNVIDIFKSH